MKKLFRIFAIVLMSALAISLTACEPEVKPGGGDEEPPVEELTVDPGELTFKADDTEPQTIEVESTSPWTAVASEEWIHITPEEGEGDDTITVTVDPGTEARSGSITVESGELTETVTINQAAPEYIAVIDVSLNETEKTMAIGDELQLTATVTPDEATNPSITWDSSDDAVATVDENGLVKAIAPGPATITVATVDGNHTADCVITVLAPDVYIVGNETESYVSHATLWINGEKQRLSENASEANAMTIVGDDIYVGGRDSYKAAIWKNGDMQILGSMNGFIRAICVEGNDVYAAGMENDADYQTIATIWKNGVAQVLSTKNSNVNSMVVVDGDVYAIGEEMGSDNQMYATLWNNGVAERISDVPSTATKIFASGSDIYIAWNGNGAFIRKNGVDQALDLDAPNVHGVYVADGTVYASGSNMLSRPNGTAIVWENGVGTNLSNTFSTGYALAVANGDIYVVGDEAGTESTFCATIWMNGEPQRLSTLTSRANAIIVQ